MPKKKQYDNYSEIQGRGLNILARILAASIIKNGPPHSSPASHLPDNQAKTDRTGTEDTDDQAKTDRSGTEATDEGGDGL